MSDSGVFGVHAERVVCAGWGPACAGIVVLGRRQGAAGCAQHLVTRNPEVDTVFLDRGVFRVRVGDIVGVHGMHVHGMHVYGMHVYGVHMVCIWYLARHLHFFG